MRIASHGCVDEMAIGQAGTRLVMIDHDDLESEVAGPGDFIRVVDAAIDGDEQTRAFLGDGLHSRHGRGRSPH